MITIAVCDDTVQFMQQTVDLLEQWSKEKKTAIKVDTFDNGDSLLNSLSHQAYDLIFLDIIMPMLSGIDTCAEIRKENRQTKIIFLSVSPEFGVDAFRVKANGYLLKPLAPSALFTLMDEYLTEKRESGRFLIARSMSMVRKVPLDTITYYYKCIEANISPSSCYFNIGNCYYSDDDYANAIDAYTNAIRFGGFLYESLLNRGICYIQLNKYNEAKADLKRVIDECSDSDLVESASESYEPIKNITIITKGYSATLRRTFHDHNRRLRRYRTIHAANRCPVRAMEQRKKDRHQGGYLR